MVIWQLKELSNTFTDVAKWLEDELKCKTASTLRNYLRSLTHYMLYEGTKRIPRVVSHLSMLQTSTMMEQKLWNSSLQKDITTHTAEKQIDDLGKPYFA